MVRMCSVTAGRPSASMRAGVLASGNSRRVALLTPTSVACADSSTAASSSKTLVYSNSLAGCGLPDFKVAKKGSISAAFIAADCRSEVGGLARQRVRCTAPERLTASYETLADAAVLGGSGLDGPRSISSQPNSVRAAATAKAKSDRLDVMVKIEAACAA